MLMFDLLRCMCLLQELRSLLDVRSQEQNQQKISTESERKFQEKNAAQLVSM
jgi:hypothetical protein